MPGTRSMVVGTSMFPTRDRTRNNQFRTNTDEDMSCFSFIQKLAFVIAILTCSHSLSAQNVSMVEIERYEHSCFPLQWCSFSPGDNSVVFAGCDFKHMGHWNVGDEEAVITLPQTGSMWGMFMDMAWNRDSSVLLSILQSGSSSWVIQWNTETWEESRSLRMPDSYDIRAAAYTPDNSEVVLLGLFGIKVINANTGELLREIGDQNRYPQRGMDISPDGNRLVVVTDSGDVWMYDYSSGEKLWSVKRTFPVYIVQFSPDGSRVLLAGLEVENSKYFVEAVEYDAVNGNKLASYRGHTHAISSARYNRDGTRIVTACWDYTVRVWSTESEEEIASAQLEDPGQWAEFSEDGSRIVVADTTGVGVWELQLSSSVSNRVAGESASRLLNVHPNPVRGVLRVPFLLSESSDIRLTLVDERGTEVMELVAGHYDAGKHEAVAESFELPSGPYLVVLRSNAGDIDHRTITILR